MYFALDESFTFVHFGVKPHVDALVYKSKGGRAGSSNFWKKSLGVGNEFWSKSQWGFHCIFINKIFKNVPGVRVSYVIPPYALKLPAPRVHLWVKRTWINAIIRTDFCFTDKLKKEFIALFAVLLLFFFHISISVWLR